MPVLELFDTTLRDGTQGEHVTLSARDKLRIAQRLDAFGLAVIEGGWPGSNPKDAAFFEQARDYDWTAQLCAFGATRRAGLAPDDDPNLHALLAAQTPACSIFGKSWTLHAEVALGISLAENLDLIGSSVAYLRAHGKRVIYDAEHFFDGYAADAAYALETLTAAAEAGASVLVLCDTNGGTLPLRVHDVVADVVRRFPHLPIGIHTHNDGGCAVANSLMAVAAGARHVQGTIGGLGERTGNADLCALLPALQVKMGFEVVPPARLAELTDLARFVFEVANLDPDDRAPYVGRSAFAHKGGIHVSAVMKEPKAYEHLPPETVGNRRRVLVSDLSGQSNIRYKAAELGVDLDAAPASARHALQRLKDLEHLGYEFQGAEASFELLLREVRGEATAFFTLEHFHTHSGIDRGGDNVAEATLAVWVDGVRAFAAAEGNGPVDALSAALHQALRGFYPALEAVQLADYKVRVLTPQDGTAAVVRVLIEHQDAGHPERRWHTVGVSHNILDASWQALADGIRFFLLKGGPAFAPTGDGAAAQPVVATAA